MSKVSIGYYRLDRSQPGLREGKDKTNLDTLDRSGSGLGDGGGDTWERRKWQVWKSYESTTRWVITYLPS